MCLLSSLAAFGNRKIKQISHCKSEYSLTISRIAGQSQIAGNGRSVKMHRWTCLKNVHFIDCLVFATAGIQCNIPVSEQKLNLAVFIVMIWSHSGLQLRVGTETVRWEIDLS